MPAQSFAEPAPVRVLLVDDHPSLRKVVKTLIAITGVEVVECGDSRDLLRCFDECLPDWVILDIEMTGLDGLAATRQLKASRPEARVLGLAQHDDDDLRRAAAEAGVCGFVRKDNLEALRQIIVPNSLDLTTEIRRIPDPIL